MDQTIPDAPEIQGDGFVELAHADYPDCLMTTDGVAAILDDPTYRIIEVDMDPAAYDEVHLAGAILWDWERQLRNQETHEILTPQEFAALLGQSGISPTHRIVLYGDNNNWFACWAYWLLHMMGHQQVFLMDGGTRKWFAEGRPVTSDAPCVMPGSYPARAFDLRDKASTENVFESMFNAKTHRLIDVRSAAEFEGQFRGPAGLEPRCAVAGRIPGAINIPWNLSCNPDGTFKNPIELSDLYESFDVNPDNTVVTYCAIGERASLSWFVLRMLLKYNVVMNYDRSMSEWSRLANAPMITGRAA